jgi:hypothetical protein
MDLLKDQRKQLKRARHVSIIDHTNCNFVWVPFKLCFTSVCALNVHTPSLLCLRFLTVHTIFAHTETTVSGSDTAAPCTRAHSTQEV